MGSKRTEQKNNSGKNVKFWKKTYLEEFCVVGSSGKEDAMLFCNLDQESSSMMLRIPKFQEEELILKYCIFPKVLLSINLLINGCLISSIFILYNYVNHSYFKGSLTMWRVSPVTIVEPGRRRAKAVCLFRICKFSEFLTELFMCSSVPDELVKKVNLFLFYVESGSVRDFC